MTKARASIFDDEAPDLDVSSFGTKPRGAARPDAAAVRQVAERAGFPSREPSTPATRRPRPTTGRNVQFNMKISADYLARFEALTDRLGMRSKAEALERAIEALEREVARGGGRD